MKNNKIIWMIALLGVVQFVSAQSDSDADALSEEEVRAANAQEQVVQLETLAEEQDPSAYMDSDQAAIERAQEAEEASQSSSEMEKEEENEDDGGITIGVTVTRKIDEDEAKQKFAHERVAVGSGQTLKENEVAREFVTIAGNSAVHGEVRAEMVTVFGNSFLDGEVGREMVTVFGSSEINGRVNGEVAVIFGSLKLGPEAHVEGEIVVIGGSIEKDPEAYVGGGMVQPLPVDFLSFDNIPEFVHSTLMLLRPLSLSVPFTLWIAAGFLGFYWVLTLLFPGIVTKGADWVLEKPGQSLVAGLLVSVLYIPFQLLLIITVIGLILLPVVKVLFIVAFLVGKASVLVFLGRRLATVFKSDFLANPLVAILVGGVLMAGFYLIPVVGFIMYAATSIIGLGVIWLVFVDGMSAKRPPAVAGAGPRKVPSPTSVGVQSASQQASDASSTEDTATPGNEAPQVAAPAPKPGTSVNELDPSERMLFERCGFWVRALATTVDWMLLVLLEMMVPVLPLPLVALVYFVGMWAWKGSSLGGMALGIRVQMVGGENITGGAAIVRSLVSLVSLLPMGLGFFWVSWDPDRQSWHDKVTGTVVAKVPQGYSMN